MKKQFGGRVVSRTAIGGIVCHYYPRPGFGTCLRVGLTHRRGGGEECGHYLEKKELFYLHFPDANGLFMFTINVALISPTFQARGSFPSAR